MWNVAETESAYNDRVALIADILATSTVDAFEERTYNERAAIFLPLKPFVEPEY